VDRIYAEINTVINGCGKCSTEEVSSEVSVCISELVAQTDRINYFLTSRRVAASDRDIPNFAQFAQA
jgi:hypothetical protein